MSTATVSARPFEFGRVIENTLHVLGKNPWTYLGLSALFVGVPSLVGTFVLLHLKQAGVIDSTGVQAAMAQFAFSAIVGLFSYPALAGAYVVAIAQLGGRRVGFGEAASAGLRHWPSLFAVGVLSGLGVTLGLILLVVPGVILAVMWLLAGPALVIEGLPPTAALNRSQALTRGNRWAMFGMLLLLVVAGAVIGLVLGLLAVLLWGVLHLAGPALGLPRFTALSPFLSVMVQTVVFPVHGATYACIYADRAGQGGASPQTVAQTFA